MAALFLTALFVIVAVSTALALADAWLRGQYVLGTLLEERALLERGFVPVAKAQPTHRLRPAAFNRTIRHRRSATQAHLYVEPLFESDAA